MNSSFLNFFSLQGKTALITGGFSGIGAAIYLAAPASAYVHGQVADGGWLVR